jgi:transcriptional regulator with XRE-family HTH domain
MARKSANQIDAIVGKKIRARRVAAGVTQDSLGKALGITFQQIQKYESGTNRVAAGRLYEIANLLNVPVTYFYEGLHHAPDIVEPPSDAEVIGQGLDRIENRSRRKLAVKLVLALVRELETE